MHRYIDLLRVLFLVAILQYLQVRQVNELLRSEIYRTSEIPTRTIRRFSVVNGLVIAIIAMLRVDMPWVFVLAAELQIFSAFGIKGGVGNDWWTIVVEALVIAANIVAHFWTYGYTTVELVELMDFQEHFVQNLSIYTLRSLTLVALVLDAVILFSLTGIKSVFGGDKIAQLCNCGKTKKNKMG